jgi:SNF2 family DNA or RNA helicase
MLKPLKKIYQKAKQTGYQWLAAESGTLIAHLAPQEVQIASEAEKLHELLGTQSLINLHPVRLGWRKLLERLRDIGKTEQQLGSSLGQPQNLRLVWVCQKDLKADDFSFHPYTQKQSVPPRGKRRHMSGSWGRIRRMRLSDLYKSHIEQKPYLTPQDHRICTHLLIRGEKNRSDWAIYFDRDYKFDPKPSLLAIANHPLLFKEAREGSDLVRRKLTLSLEKPTFKVLYPDDQHLSLQFQPKLDQLPEIENEDKALIIQNKEGETYQLIECTSIHRQIAELIDQDIRIPRGEERLLHDVIDQLSEYVVVHSDLGDITEHAQADPTPILTLLATEEGGLKIQLRVQPFAQGGTLFYPGEGGSNLSTTIGGRKIRVERNLDEETRLKTLVLDTCTLFDDLKTESGDWVLEHREQYLELLLQLRPLEDQVKIQMPEGQELRVSRPEVNVESFSCKVERSSKSWFKIDGDLVIDLDFRLSIKELLERERVGRFIVLGEGDFLALSDQLVSMLDELSEVTEIHEQGVRFMETLAVPAEGVLEGHGIEMSSDRHWKRVQSKIKKMKGQQKTVPPTDLNATLRDYQLEGFRWLVNFAQLGSGGVCLADDMGLGKTLQALTTLLYFADKGPSLVIAPTSVVQNWINESHHFTPSLNVSRFGGTRDQRLQMINHLRPRDVILCTYGLLKTEVDLLATPNWNIVVLDEAQNIKNHATQAAKAAVRLRSHFRFVTTGTPIENNLTELWSLFQFLNPHLLKGIRDFRDRFLNPIEKSDSYAARKRLNRLISPFILRRTKENVLDDLPPLTEITLTVDLSDEERNLYEGIKMEHLYEIEEQLSQGDSKARMQLFALLTKLRQISCHPRLAFSDIDMESSKLNAFKTLVSRLIEGNHKVLVFSQFVKHLEILREELEHLRISYQYLTGSTSTKDRQKHVDAFQSGEGDVFLISLKAGGVGLNLTAADYVIHMDPWWNPAVEDQASDRAHRIGQERPVTVYRLVGKDTIEEQIVALHQHKRDLADAILEGSDKVFNTGELLSILKDEMRSSSSQSSRQRGEAVDYEHVL